MDRDFLRRGVIKQIDKMRNPAISSEDWNIIVRYVRGHYRDSAEKLSNYRIHYWRTLFWHWILFAKNSGMSPEEILRLKWRQIEIIDEGRTNSKGEREPWEVAYIYTIRSKTKQAREIPVNQARELRRWKKIQEDYIAAHNLDQKITKDSLVFGNPHNELRTYAYSNYQRAWKEVRDAVGDKLNGHRFSRHHYTIYSMRSTFIEDHLLKGTPVFEVAEMAGHSVNETQKTYARLNLRKKGAEITLPKLGKQPTLGQKSDLFG
jgi:integrase